jgi:hypothetical protein
MSPDTPLPPEQLRTVFRYCYWCEQASAGPVTYHTGTLARMGWQCAHCGYIADLFNRPWRDEYAGHGEAAAELLGRASLEEDPEIGQELARRVMGELILANYALEQFLAGVTQQVDDLRKGWTL